MLNGFAFRRKMYYLCTSEEERAPNTGFFPLFFGHYKGRNTSEVGNSRCFCGFSKCFCGNFLGFIGARIDDIGIRKVKRYLFSNPTFFTFRGTTQVVYCWLGALFGAPRKSNLLVAQDRAKRRPGYCRPSPVFALQRQKRTTPRLLFVHILHLPKCETAGLGPRKLRYRQRYLGENV